MTTIEIRPYIPFYKRCIRIIYVNIPAILLISFLGGLIIGFDNINTYLIACVAFALSPRTWNRNRYYYQLKLDKENITICYYLLWKRKRIFPLKKIRVQYCISTNKKNHYVSIAEKEAVKNWLFSVSDYKLLNSYPMSYDKIIEICEQLKIHSDITIEEDK